MKIEIENPVNTRNRKIGVGIAALLVLALLVSVGLQGAESTNKAKEAQDLIVEAAQSDIGDANLSSYEPSVVRNKIQTAKSKLDSAEEIEGESERIRYLRDSAELVLTANTMMTNLKQVMNGMDSAGAYVSSDRYDDALSEINSVSGDISSAKDNLNQVENQFQELKSYDYEVDELTESNFNDDVSELESLLNYMENYAEGYKAMVKGLQNLDSASNNLDQEGYQRAGNYYLDAKQNFQEARDTFRSMEETALSDYQSTVISLGCRNRKLMSLSEKSYQLTQALEEGNQQEYERLNEEIQSIDVESCN